MNETEKWKQRFERERKARKESERLLEAKSTELYHSNQQLKQLTANLEQRVEERTREITRLMMESEAARQQALRANEAKSEFIANMSHEIRTPLNAILGFVTILRDSPLTDEQKEHIEDMRKSGEGLLAIVNDVLDFSKIEAGQLKLEEIPFDLNETIENTVTPFRVLAAKKNLDLEIKTDLRIPLVLKGDPYRLRQVLTNLVGNSLKFTRQGRVTVALSLQKSSNHKVQIRFSVEDTGVGISQSKLDRIFDSFTQSDTSTTREFGGTGLGLAISRRICRLMGDDLQVSSTLGEGSNFSFSPVFETVDRMPSEAPVEPETDLRRLRVILADDNPVNRKVGRLLLKRLGINARVAVDGLETLQMVETSQVDVILMDLHMPVVDGIDATRYIRELLPPNKQPCVIALTAAATAEDKAKCLDAGMDQFITKPLRPGELKKAFASVSPRE